MPRVIWFIALMILPAHAKPPAEGETSFAVFEAWLSPHQEPKEESDQPGFAEKAGLSNVKPSTPREQRKSRGWGQLKFRKNMSEAFVEVTMEGVDPADIVMFHIHCGRPGVLGPILIDLGKGVTDWSKAVVGGTLRLELTNASVNSLGHAHGLAPRLPEACPIGSGLPSTVKTLSGVHHLARRGLLYFNLHTKAHTFFGEMRGQMYPVSE